MDLTDQQWTIIERPRVWTALLCSLVPEDQTDESVLGKIQALVKE
jgi:hypothetical protein